MTSTIKSVIGDFNIQKLQQKNKELHEIGTPVAIKNAIKSAIAQYKDGDFKVGGMNKKYTVADMEAIAVYTTTATAQNWSLPARGDDVPTEVLYIMTQNGGYYYDYFNNVIAASLDELHVKDVGEWTNYLLEGEGSEVSQYFQFYYTVNNSPELTTLVTSYIDSTDAAAKFKTAHPLANIVSVRGLTKAQAVERGLNT